MKINPELKSLIPPLTPEEYNGLEQSIINEGCRDAIVTWQGFIVDGHNRYEICTKHNIAFNSIEKEFDNIEAVKVWMIDNQKSRRNLTDGWKWELAQTRKELLKEKGKENMSKGGGDKKTPLSIVDKPDISPINTRNELAKELGWSTGKVAMADKVWKESKPEVKEQIKAGEVSINEAYNNLKPKAHVSNNSGENEWYTPKNIVESARYVMGFIDLDPASSEIANKTIKAKKYFDKETDGLKQAWYGNLWINPPYAQPLISYFSEKLVKEIDSINQCCFLSNNATETNWLQPLLKRCNAVCFFKGRLRFVDVDGKEGTAPLQGQVLLYFGSNVNKFIEEFNNYGICLKGVQ